MYRSCDKTSCKKIKKFPQICFRYILADFLLNLVVGF